MKTFEDLLKNVDIASRLNYSIEIGVVSSDTNRKETYDIGITNAQLMYIHENGSTANNIPKRPVLQMTIDYANSGPINDVLGRCCEGIVSGWTQQQIEDELNRFCIRLERYARDLIRKKKLAPNAPSTIKAKGSDIPLLDTGQLMRSITCRLKKR